MHVVYLVQTVEGPVGRAEGGEDAAAQFETTSPDLEGGLEDQHRCIVLGLGQQLLPDHRDDHERGLVQLHRLQLPVGRLQGACATVQHKIIPDAPKQSNVIKIAWQ